MIFKKVIKMWWTSNIIAAVLVVGFLRFQNVNFTGNESYKLGSGHTAETCEAECQYDVRCVGYLLIKGNDNWCYFRSNKSQFKFFAVNHQTVGGIKLKRSLESKGPPSHKKESQKN